MNKNTELRWQTLCRLAMHESNPDRLLKLVQELNAELGKLEDHRNVPAPRPQTPVRKTA
jgi:hypothetical protein